MKRNEGGEGRCDQFIVPADRYLRLQGGSLPVIKPHHTPSSNRKQLSHFHFHFHFHHYHSTEVVNAVARFGQQVLDRFAIFAIHDKTRGSFFRVGVLLARSCADTKRKRVVWTDTRIKDIQRSRDAALQSLSCNVVYFAAVTFVVGSAAGQDMTGDILLVTSLLSLVFTDQQAKVTPVFVCSVLAPLFSFP